MSTLAAQRCLNHEEREAACRCPECRNYFCRECVILFEERMLCAACLARVADVTKREAKRTFGFAGLLVAVAGFLVVWVLFYCAGWAMLQLREQIPEVETSSNVSVIMS